MTPPSLSPIGGNGKIVALPCSCGTAPSSSGLISDKRTPFRASETCVAAYSPSRLRRQANRLVEEGLQVNCKIFAGGIPPGPGRRRQGWVDMSGARPGHHICRVFESGAGKLVDECSFRAVSVRSSSGIPMNDRIELVKVFSVTKARERDALGERVTAWLEAHPEFRLAPDGRRAHLGQRLPLYVDGPDRRRRPLGDLGRLRAARRQAWFASLTVALRQRPCMSRGVAPSRHHPRASPAGRPLIWGGEAQVPSGRRSSAGRWRCKVRPGRGASPAPLRLEGGRRRDGDSRWPSPGVERSCSGAASDRPTAAGARWMPSMHRFGTRSSGATRAPPIWRATSALTRSFPLRRPSA